MKIVKSSTLIFLLLAIATIPSSCLLTDEEEIVKCGPKQKLFIAIVNVDKPVTIANYVTQDGTYSYYEFLFPSELINLELCVEEHCKLICEVDFKENPSQNLKGMKVDGMIEIGFTGHRMVFTKNSTNLEFTSDNDFGLKQSFGDRSYGWITGQVKISFETFGTYQQEVDILNQLLKHINVNFDYYQTKL